MPGLNEQGFLQVHHSGFKQQQDIAVLTTLVSLFNKTGIVEKLELLQLQGMLSRQFAEEDIKRYLEKYAVSFP